ncbi:MAG: DNA gyrase subunit A [Tissierellia bacterium]|nr:DNA gyrase subunit A [Tissierellia bacterium]
MEKAYIDYSMTVITSRALPDVRDGLKPVHRRILYAMNQLGLTSEKAHRKSAAIVGEVMGNYHPHGDSAIYNSMVRLAQSFSMRYPLIDGHGNFGSMDGDQPAAMRYTEARMSGLANEMLRDIDKNTIDTYPNFDETLQQPWVLPARFPNLLVNGVTGIAVGMTTSIPPHNMGEIIDATIQVIDHPETSIDELLEIVQGPDFPTGGIIMGREAMRKAYQTGLGRIRLRSRVTIEESGKDRFRIVVTEIPFMTNKANLLEGIANLVKAKRIDGITELRDESNLKHGVRIVMELRRDVNSNVVLNQLYRHSGLQGVVSMIFIALDRGVPKTFTLKQLIEKYIEHQEEVETRRVQFDLQKALDRAHIIEGLLRALDHIDEIIRIIRSAYNDAKELLMEAFDFSEIQANSILSMQLRRLQGLEYDKLQDELQELMKNIEYYNQVLADRNLLMDIIKTTLLEIRRKYHDERRTTIEVNGEEIEDEDLIEEKKMIITMTQRGYIKRVDQETYQSQHRGGRGIAGLSVREEDVVQNIFSTSTHSTLLYITNHGRVHRQKAYFVPESSRQSRGTPIVNLLQLEPGEVVTAVIPVDDFDEQMIIMVTKKGMINKIALSSVDSRRTTGLKLMKLDDDDEIMHVQLTDDTKDIFVATRKGKAIRFEPSSVRVLSRDTRGVRAIKLQDNDEVVSVSIIEPDSHILTVTENGYGKRTHESQYRTQGRYGYGILNYNLSEKTGDVIMSGVVGSDDEMLLINSLGTVIRVRVNDISSIGRNTQGVSLMRLEDGVTLIAATKAMEVDINDNEEPDEADSEIASEDDSLDEYDKNQNEEE